MSFMSASAACGCGAEGGGASAAGGAGRRAGDAEGAGGAPPAKGLTKHVNTKISGALQGARKARADVHEKSFGCLARRPKSLYQKSLQSFFAADL